MSVDYWAPSVNRKWWYGYQRTPEKLLIIIQKQDDKWHVWLTNDGQLVTTHDTLKQAKIAGLIRL